MQGLRYIEDAVTLSLDAEKCNGSSARTASSPSARTSEPTSPTAARAWSAERAR